MPDDSDLPQEFWPRRRPLSDARMEVLKQIRKFGMSLTETQIDLCTLILYGTWLDARRALPAGCAERRKQKERKDGKK